MTVERGKAAEEFFPVLCKLEALLQNAKTFQHVAANQPAHLNVELVPATGIVVG